MQIIGRLAKHIRGRECGQQRDRLTILRREWEERQKKDEDEGRVGGNDTNTKSYQDKQNRIAERIKKTAE